jgi:predicted TIM-barrel fold metal-dependent hydrolase
MEARAALYRGRLVGWKTYPGWGDPGGGAANGWWLDDDVGQAYVDQVLRISKRTGMPPNMAIHKGFAIPGVLDGDKCSPRDIGPIARMFPEARFITYHSGFDGEVQAPYPGDSR